MLSMTTAMVAMAMAGLAGLAPAAAQQVPERESEPASARATRFAPPAPRLPADAVASGRKERDLSTGWKFRFGEAESTTVTAPAFDDAGWQTVDVPHTWNRVGSYGTTRSPQSDNRQGVAWYRLDIAAAAASKDARHYLDFAGVGTIAEIWVNGVSVGEHRGAYTRFRFDVTDQWKAGSHNIIAVRVDNSKAAQGSSTGEILPLAGDFFVHGGLYRGVKLITAGSAGFDLLDHGGPGLYARASDVTAASAKVELLSRLRNAENRPRRLIAVATLLDADGREVARATTPVTLGAAASGEVSQSLTLANPHLWNGRADPYRYQVAVTLMDGRKAVDRVVQPLGIRTFRFDPDKGFFLNDRHVALHGVSRHQDRLDKGYALSREDHETDMAMIAEMGANSVRGAHYPHDDEWYDLADRYGMVMWAEVPYISASSFDGTDGTPATFANARQQMTELIRQQYNHPSIIMWSTGNEVDASMLFLKTDRPARGLKLLQDLTALTKAEDPYRPTVFADCCEDTPFGRAGQQVLTGTTDLNGFNRYYGWYYGKPADNATELDKLHAKHPATPMSISEYGAGGATSQHSDDPRGGPIASFGRPHPEEFESYYHEEAWKAYKARPYLFATWVWNMFDFASDLREEGDAIDINDKGLVTFDRKIKKDAFYFYKASWSDQPTLYLTSRRYTDRAYPVMDVRAYSNAQRASLTVNGRPVGDADCVDAICVWRGVKLSPGQNRVVANATVNGTTVEDSVVWTAPDAKQGLFIDSGTLAGHVAANGQRFGSDAFFEGGSPSTMTPQLPRGPSAKKVVTGTADPLLYDSYRSGEFSYTLPVSDGRWTLIVHSFETNAALAESRSFAIKVDGKTLVDQFNPAKKAGGVLKAVVLELPITVEGGRTKIDFVKQGGSALVAGIELRPR